MDPVLQRDDKRSEQMADGERIAKYMANGGLCSRRMAETWILAGRVKVNGEVIADLGRRINEGDMVLVDNKPVKKDKEIRVWIYHKPVGLVTTHRDPAGRPTVFESLPKNMPRVISVGRLDLNSEGLLLLTNNGEFSRYMELPATGLARQYRVRAYGHFKLEYVDMLAKGMTVDGVHYGKVIIEQEPNPDGKNFWLKMTLFEGKNREIRKLLAALDLQVSRLIRTSYGEYKLGNLPVGEVIEVKPIQFKAI
jgi:23S rRNA pseudouridine2605 synthase